MTTKDLMGETIYCLDMKTGKVKSEWRYYNKIGNIIFYLILLVDGLQPHILCYTIIQKDKTYFFFAGYIIRYGETRAFASIFEFKDDNYVHIHSKIIKEIGEGIMKVVHCGHNKEEKDVIVALTDISLVILNITDEKITVVEIIKDLHKDKIQTSLYFNSQMVTCSESGDVKLTQVIERKSLSSANSIEDIN